MNTGAALAVLRAGSQTVTTLAADLGLSRTAVEEIVRDLLELGWIRAEDDFAGRARPGRPAKRYVFAAEAGHIAGVDIGVHKVLAAVADLDGRILAIRRADVDESDPVETRFAAARRVLEEAVAEAGLEPGSVWCVGVGVPGEVDAEGTVTRYGGVGLPGWAGTGIRGELSAAWNVPVLVESDNNLGLAAEYWRGSAVDADDVVYILSGNRTSAALLIGGRVFRGHNGGAGLVGALPELGWAEAPDHVARLSEAGIEPTREAMFRAATAGDPAAAAALDLFARSLAKGIAAMALAVDPQKIVLGGGVSQGGETILRPVSGYVDRFAGRPVPLVLSTLGGDAVAIGALKLALDHIAAQLERESATSPGFPRPDAGLGMVEGTPRTP
jgi:predicted NBD/HSP70 family sugar kinase